MQTCRQFKRSLITEDREKYIRILEFKYNKVCMLLEVIEGG